MKEKADLEFLGAIFDLDGTLLDSMGVWRRIDEEFLAKRGIQVPQDYLEAITPLCFQTAAEYTIQRFGFSETPEMLIAEWQEMAMEAYAHKVPLKPGVREYLERLQEQGVKIAAATSGDQELFIPCLKNNGIFEYFHSFTMVKEVSRGKGYPDVYQLAAKRIGLEPQDCMVFEDIYAGVAGAKMGSFPVVGILDSNSAYEWEKIRVHADLVIEDFQELL